MGEFVLFRTSKQHRAPDEAIPKKKKKSWIYKIIKGGRRKEKKEWIKSTKVSKRT